MGDSCCGRDALSPVLLNQTKISRSARRRRKHGKINMLREEEKTKLSVPGTGERMGVHRCRFVQWMPSAINSAAWHNSSKKFAIGRANGSLQIYERVVSWRLCASMRDPRGFAIDSILWTSSGRIFTAGPFSSMITEWDIAMRLPKSSIIDVPGGGIWALTLVDNGSMLAVASEDCHIRLFRLVSNGKEEEVPLFIPTSRSFAFPGHLFTDSKQDTRILSMIWNSCTNQLVTGSSLGDIVIWDIVAGSLLRSVQILNLGNRYTGMIWSLSVLSKGHVVVAGDSRGQISFWNVSTGSLLSTHRVHEGEVLSLASVPGSELVIAAGVDPTLHCFKKLASSGDEGGVDVWTWTTGVGMAPITIHRLDVRVMTVSPNGSYLISAGLDPDFLLHDLKLEALGRYEIFPYFDQIPGSFISTNGSGKFLVTSVGGTSNISGQIWSILPQNGGEPSLEFQFTLNDHIFTQAFDEHWMALGIQHHPSIRLWRRSDDGTWKDGGSIALSKPPHLLALASGGDDGDFPAPLLWIVQPKKVSLVQLGDSVTQLEDWNISSKTVFSPDFIRATSTFAILGSSSSLLIVERASSQQRWLSPPSLMIGSFFVDAVVYKDILVGISNLSQSLSFSGSPVLAYALVSIWDLKSNHLLRYSLVPLAPALSSRSSSLLKGAFMLEGDLILHSDRIYRLNMEYLRTNENICLLGMSNLTCGPKVATTAADVGAQVSLALPLILSTPRGTENDPISSIIAVFPNASDIVVIERSLEDIYAQLPPAFRKALPFQRS
ncbi:hypothetical protein DI09_33p160 [Mitosporidium daphniae]|uniref:Uncharacterized protein n=1 Tax=Mitosporidium daphniae TaxID=1485682 RepID=A0A098VRQ9_9MICR|nr:uncharacterized protein DI09_33p160 [Mitosporidium daphniae]KGG51499.1 hypothetical protein DI09_33p160 [Mitosporidium daphniae]|eukprot:XP_013237926.1 uncharacterized protein DI09_33p160 [Mitosporidium daphniae]